MKLVDADELALMVKRLIEMMPTVDPVKHGRWMAHDSSTRGVPTEACSICYVWSYGCNENYCPNCGALMDEEE